MSDHWRIDSVRQLLATDKEDTNKVNHLNILCWEYKNIGQYDTALHYGNAALDVGKKINFPKGIAQSYNNIGFIYKRQGNYPQAFGNYFASLEIRERLGDKLSIAQARLSIGSIYEFQRNYAKALENYSAAMKIAEELGQKHLLATLYHNTGNVYYYHANATPSDSSALREELYKKSLENYFVSLNRRKETGDRQGTAGLYNNIGVIYFEKNDFAKALENHFSSLKLSEETGDKHSIARSNNNISKVLFKQNKIAEAKKQSLLALDIAKEIGAKGSIKDAYELLAICDSALGNWKDAYHWQSLLAQIKENFFNEEITKQITEMQTKYETEKKEQHIKLQDAELKKEKLIRMFVVGGLLLAVIFSLGLLNRFLFIRKQRKILSEKNEQINKQNETLKTLNTELIISEENLTQANNSKNQLLSMLSHDLYNPVTSLINYTGAITKQNEQLNKEELILALKKINNAAIPLEHLLENILQWARMQSNKIEPHWIKTDVAKLTEEIIRIYQPVASLNGVNMSFAKNGEAMITTDQLMLNFILRNIINNAVKFSPAGKNIFVEIKKNQSQLHISVRDEGKGFGIDILAILNEREMNQMVKSQGSGSGIGLSVSREFIRQLKGEIIFSNRRNGGAEVTISIAGSG